MSATTLGVKLDAGTRERLKQAARTIDRTPHWVVKQAIFSYLERLEREGAPPPSSEAHDEAGGAGEAGEPALPPTVPAEQPFLDFAQSVLPESVLRAAITAATRPASPAAQATAAPSTTLSGSPRRSAPSSAAAASRSPA